MVTLKDLEQFRQKTKLLQKNFLGQVEMGFGDHPKWQLLRGVIMDTFGNYGVDGLTKELIEKVGGGWREEKTTR